MQLLRKLGSLALGTRLSEIGEQLYKEVQTIYRAQDIDFDPRNFLIFRALLESNEEGSVCRIASAVHCTHARASQKLSELEEQRLVEKVEGGDDRRKSCYQLTAKGKQLVSRLEPIWAALELTLRTEFGTDALLSEIYRFEEDLQPGKLSSRVLARLAEKKKADFGRESAGLLFRVIPPPFSKEVLTEFERLNRAWIREFDFTLEPTDLELFHSLSAYVAKHQGVLMIAESEGMVVGTALLLLRSKGEFEIAKFCVDEKVRNRGIGRRLLAFCETEARMMGAERIILETNTRLKAARDVYERSGYIIEPNSNSEYKRVDLIMSKKL